MANVEEATSWGDFTHKGKTYELSHLNAHHVSYTHQQTENTYQFYVTYSFHCFTDKHSSGPIYYALNEARAADFGRYELSKQLPRIIERLPEPDVIVCHAGHGQYAAIKVKDDLGKVINYFVAFSAFRERRKLRLHVEVRTLWPKSEGVKK